MLVLHQEQASENFCMVMCCDNAGEQNH